MSDFDNVNLEYQKSLKLARKISSKPKLMIPKKDGLRKLDKIIDNLKYLLDESGFEYEINTRQYECFPESISVEIETKSFDTSRNNHYMFREVINSVDSFGFLTLTNGMTKYSFTIYDMYTNALEKNKKF